MLAFVESHLASVDELDVLMTLTESSSRWWDANTISRERGIPTTVSRKILDHLAARSLLDIRITDEVRYQFRPATSELASAVAGLVNEYRCHPAAVVRAVAVQSASRGARDFADAFRIRRDDDG